MSGGGIDDEARGITPRNRGLAAGPPRLKRRCHQRRVRWRGSLRRLEDDVRKWMATCVQSRTPVRGVSDDGEGKLAPAHRERELVPGNPSLKLLHDRWSHARQGPQLNPWLTNTDALEWITITASYKWKGERVESIEFDSPDLPALKAPPPSPPPPAAKLSPDDALRRALGLAKRMQRNGRKMFKEQPVNRLVCVLEKSLSTAADDKFIANAILMEGTFTHKFLSGDWTLDDLERSFKSFFHSVKVGTDARVILSEVANVYSNQVEEVIEKASHLSKEDVAANKSWRFVARHITKRAGESKSIYSCTKVR